MDLGSLIDVSWEQFDIFKTMSESAAQGRATRANASRAEDGHVCEGHKCPHVVADDSGGYVCRLTGVTFGKQVMNGPIDNRLWETPAYFPGKRKRVSRAIAPFEEVFSTCAQVVKKLLDTSQRRQADEDRLQKLRCFPRFERSFTKIRPRRPRSDGMPTSHPF